VTEAAPIAAGQAAPALVYESDWLASRPFFYNVRTGAAGPDINAVIDLGALEFDPEGFNDYLDFGFSVFERTPVRDVHMLRHSSRLWRDPDGGLRVEYLDDPAYPRLEQRSTVPEVLELAEARINEAAGVAGDIVVPTSGGCDSRLIDLLVHDRARIRAFTYGVSDDPRRSTEAVKARELAQRLGLHWQLVPLGDFHDHLDDWDALYGVSTHAHGMYHMEFYRRIGERVAAGSRVLSGACGEWFEGDDPEVRVVPTLRGPDDVLSVFRYSLLNADSSQSRFRSERLGAQRLLETEPRIRDEMLPRVFTVVRIRLALLSYLLAVPAARGLEPRAPFLDIDLAMRMLTLPDDLREERSWLHRYFAERGVDLESAPQPSDNRNTLNYRGMRRRPLRPLDAELLAEVVKPEYVRHVNREIGPLGLTWEVLWRLGYTPGFRRAVAPLRRRGFTGRRLAAYGAYLTLLPVEKLLRRRDAAARNGGAA
jgi:asparagine synthetase B (glutamine-hydrolysing)